MFEFAPAAITVVCLWYAGAVGGARQGRGWFVRNWLAGTVATFVAIIVFVAMISGGVWSIVGIAVSAVAAAMAWQARKMPKSDGAEAVTPEA